MSRCIAFDMKKPIEAYEHMSLETVREYGRQAYGHLLYVWDEGERTLMRCRACGGYVLVQQSEYHGMEDDSYYLDYFPVESEEEADELNRKYSGEEIEEQFGDRYLMVTDTSVFVWSDHSE